MSTLLLAAIVYAGIGYYDALRDATELKIRADALIAAKRGPDDLTPTKLEQLLRVEDPTFWHHNGLDIQTSGAGLTTLTQSLAKRLAFHHFKPGIGKLRQTTYAMGLEQRLSKRQILALFLDTAQLGRGPHGWMQGMFVASEQMYGRQPANLTNREWLSLIAVLIAPGQYNLRAGDTKLNDRVRRIERLLAGACHPQSGRDVWLEGCT
ncbi:transglycosylase domain-containing protein [Sphingomonas qomolangmaensis]|uniref:Transglycosylase domain-containing protein n=1 Tax=Sphingomonas qomolangmaensis TaxID=2918765 RepID=A0ABY5L8Y9_9SPHN|nr:transglycosylase domain-containing protein [Sphingomonas qomolangmaensis]UUL82215.1 transglycosylase domain-containing protein [Sphingomonas qomolangmaensis]